MTIKYYFVEGGRRRKFSQQWATAAAATTTTAVWVWNIISAQFPYVFITKQTIAEAAAAVVEL